ncbi:3-oxo-tetronate kinase [Okibacterium fritillariae]|uniref:3-oxo-tetronate kinase n=1 Tax=Okibacterium fritillariae TaxID=123320 RepID=A0A1T5KBG6_9MICO|nr:3-oxo-tetronate kinase [Okibacterium fritillariae]SKC61016.1 Uncharacterized conserved protein YgbK, DUF1537 family [Okibacterium fritillariae]
MRRLGAIADDFTGATDLATNLAKRGFRVVVIPGGALDAAEARVRALPDRPDAVVIALKSRTAPVATAVADSLRALDLLESLDCDRFYLKYCSTFDSTDEGNIGPVLDALSKRLDAGRVVVVPSFPANGRTVEGGILSVHGVPLAESPMKDHPLTPMRRSRVADLLAPQTSAPVGEVYSDVVDRGSEALAEALSQSSARYVVVDAATDAQLDTIAGATAGDVLVSGGSGLALGMTPPQADVEQGSGSLPAAVDAGADTDDTLDVAARPHAGSLVVSGSASSMTRTQVAHGRAHLPARKIDVQALIDDAPAELGRAVVWVLAHAFDEDADGAPRPPLVYAVDSLDDLSVSYRYPDGLAPADRPHPSELIEQHLGALVATVAERGVTHILVAGGETSGSTVTALGLSELVIGAEIAPGVCWAQGHTAHGTLVDIALKSGNFGSEDMFTSAWKVLHP